MEPHEEQMRKVLEKYLSEATMDAIIGTKIPNLTKATVDFILIKIREHPLESFLECLEAIIETALQNEALVEQVMSSLVLITYGATGAVPLSEEKRKRLANELIEQHRENVALIEGRQETLAGSYGGPFLATFGSIIKNLWGLLGKLAELDYGESKTV